MSETATLLVTCPDQKGLVSGISNFIFRNGGNILQSDQYTDVEAGIFLARFEFHLDGFQIRADQIAERFRALGNEFSMKFARLLQRLIVRGNRIGRVGSLVAMFAPPLAAWTDGRDLRPVEAKSFRQQWTERGAKSA